MDDFGAEYIKEHSLAERLSTVIDKPEVRKLIFEHYKAEGKEDYANMAIARWRKGGPQYPPVDMLANIANIAGTNMSFLLGLTDVDCGYVPNEPAVKRSLSDLLSLKDMSESDLALSFNKNYRSVHLYKKELPVKRITAIMRIARAVDLSVDYILGYTDWETWELYAKLHKPFKGIKPGSGVHIVADKTVRTKSDVEAAISRGDGQYGIISDDGEYVLFPNGSKYSIYDDMFIGAYITITIPEVR